MRNIYDKEKAKRDKESFSGSIKPMFYNVLFSHTGSPYKNWGIRSKNIGKIISNNNPDIIGLQELRYNGDLSGIMRNLPSKYSGYDYIGNIQQNGIIYNTQTLELLEKGYIATNSSSPHRGGTWGFFRIRGTNDTLLFTSFHLTGNNRDDHVKETNSIINHMNNLKSRLQPNTIIIGGDLNYDVDNNSEGTTSKIENNLNLSCSTTSETFPKSGKSLDYICSSKNLKLKSIYNDWDYYENGYASDHIPIIGKFEY